jgi:AbiTii
VVAKTSAPDLLSEIEAGALDSDSDLPDLLRKCVSLGGVTGSARLREWATKELKGYGSDATLPSYRLTGSLLYLDGAMIGGRVTGQQVPLMMIPKEARPSVQGDIHLPFPIAELVEIVAVARRKGEDSVRLSPPLASEMVALINHALAQEDQPSWSGIRMPQSRVVERVYWMVGLSHFTAIIDTVRTTLVELVAEMRAGTRDGATLPSHEIAEQAVDIAINGNRNRVVIQQVGPHGEAAAAAGGIGSTGDAEPESKPRRLMWWLAGIAAVVAAGAAVAALLLT